MISSTGERGGDRSVMSTSSIPAEPAWWRCCGRVDVRDEDDGERERVGVRNDEDGERERVCVREDDDDGERERLKRSWR